jgi:hypothetical protein
MSPWAGRSSIWNYNREALQYQEIENLFTSQEKASNQLDIFVYCILGAAQEKCCPDGECYDLGPPWQSLRRLAPAPRCIADPVQYLLSNRYKK